MQVNSVVLLVACLSCLLPVEGSLLLAAKAKTALAKGALAIGADILTSKLVAAHHHPHLVPLPAPVVQAVPHPLPLCDDFPLPVHAPHMHPFRLSEHLRAPVLPPLFPRRAVPLPMAFPVPMAAPVPRPAVVAPPLRPLPALAPVQPPVAIVGPTMNVYPPHGQLIHHHMPGRILK